MLGRLKSLFGGAGHPFENANSAAKWLKSLHAEDAQHRVQAFVDLVPDVLDSGPPGSGFADALLHLTKALQDAERFLKEHYVLNPRMPKAMEEALWSSVVGYADAQHTLALQLLRAPVYNTLPPATQAAVSVLILQSLITVAKWHYFRLQPLPGPFWMAAHESLLAATGRGAEDLAVPTGGADSAAGDPTTCADEYVHLLLLSTISTTGFGVRQLDWVDEWLQVWSKAVPLDSQFSPTGHQYGVALDEPAGPIRIEQELDSKNARYMGTASLLAMVDNVMNTLRSGGDATRLGLPESIRQPGATELLTQLKLYWSNQPNQHRRTSERHEVNKLLDVGVGYDNVSALVKADNIERREANQSDLNFNEMIDMRLYGFVSAHTRAKQAAAVKLAQAEAKANAHFETWLVQNESEGGFGAVLPYSRQGDDLRPGSLLTVRVSEQDNWHLAVLRRLHQLDNGHLYAGLQVLGLDPLFGTFSDAVQNMPHSGRSGVITVDVRVSKPVVYVMLGMQQHLSRSVLIRTEDYATGKQLNVQFDDRMLSLTLERVIERGLGWTWAEVRPA